MGLELTCKVTLNKKTTESKVMLEGDHLQLRGGLKLKIAFADLRKVETRGGVLHLDFDGGPAAFALGEPTADKWAMRITNPPTRLDKLGVKAGTKVHLVGKFED